MSVTFDQTFSGSKNKSESLKPKDVLDKPIKRMTIEVPKTLHTQLRQASIDKGEYIRDIVVDACKEYLRKEGYKVD